MFNTLKQCGPDETQRQIYYLSSTPVDAIADLLRCGQYTLKKGVVSDMQQLGSLKTEFGQIGSLIPSQSNGEHKFLVSEVVPLLRANRGVPDAGLLRKIEAIMEKETKHEIEYNITVFVWNGEYIVKDGNKRTIAFFENRRNMDDNEVHYEVYVVVPTQRNA